MGQASRLRRRVIRRACQSHSDAKGAIRGSSEGPVRGGRGGQAATYRTCLGERPAAPLAPPMSHGEGLRQPGGLAGRRSEEVGPRASRDADRSAIARAASIDSAAQAVAGPPLTPMENLYKAARALRGVDRRGHTRLRGARRRCWRLCCRQARDPVLWPVVADECGLSGKPEC